MDEQKRPTDEQKRPSWRSQVNPLRLFVLFVVALGIVERVAPDASAATYGVVKSAINKRLEELGITSGGTYTAFTGTLTDTALTLSNTSANVGDLTIQHTPGTGGWASIDFLDIQQDVDTKRTRLNRYVYGANMFLTGGAVPGVSGPTAGWKFDAGRMVLGSTTEMSFDIDNDVVGSAPDTFIGRNAAGEVRIGATTGTADGTLVAGTVQVGAGTYLYRDQDSMLEFNSSGSGTSHVSMYLIGSAPGYRLSSSANVGWASSGDSGWGATIDTKLLRDGVGGVALGNAYGGGMTVYSAGELLSDVSLDAVTENLAPAGSRIIAVSTRVKTAVTTSSATNTYLVGDGSDIDRYGASIAGAGGTTSDSTDATADPMSWSASAHGAVTLTPPGAESFTAGAVYVVVHYLASTAPTSTP